MNGVSTSRPGRGRNDPAANSLKKRPPWVIRGAVCVVVHERERRLEGTASASSQRGIEKAEHREIVGEEVSILEETEHGEVGGDRKRDQAAHFASYAFASHQLPRMETTISGRKRMSQ